MRVAIGLFLLQAATASLHFPSYGTFLGRFSTTAVSPVSRDAAWFRDLTGTGTREPGAFLQLATSSPERFRAQARTSYADKIRAVSAIYLDAVRSGSRILPDAKAALNLVLGGDDTIFDRLYSFVLDHRYVRDVLRSLVDTEVVTDPLTAILELTRAAGDDYAAGDLALWTRLYLLLGDAGYGDDDFGGYVGGLAALLKVAHGHRLMSVDMTPDLADILARLLGRVSERDPEHSVFLVRGVVEELLGEDLADLVALLYHALRRSHPALARNLPNLRIPDIDADSNGNPGESLLEHMPLLPGGWFTEVEVTSIGLTAEWSMPRLPTSFDVTIDTEEESRVSVSSRSGIMTVFVLRLSDDEWDIRYERMTRVGAPVTRQVQPGDILLVIGPGLAHNPFGPDLRIPYLGDLRETALWLQGSLRSFAGFSHVMLVN